MRPGLIAIAAGILLTCGSSLPGQQTFPVVEGVEFAALRVHCQRLQKSLAALKAPLPADIAKALSEALHQGAAEPEAAAERIQQLLDPLCLAAVSINPESRVKAARGPAAATLRQGEESVLLVKIHNDAGVTHALSVTGPQVRAGAAKGQDRWLDVAVHADRNLGKALSGKKLEYVILRLTAHEAGKREATLRFDVGQGTQDLGFRAEVPVLFTVRQASR